MKTVLLDQSQKDQNSFPSFTWATLVNVSKKQKKKTNKHRCMLGGMPYSMSALLTSKKMVFGGESKINLEEIGCWNCPVQCEEIREPKVCIYQQKRQLSSYEDGKEEGWTYRFQIFGSRPDRSVEKGRSAHFQLVKMFVLMSSKFTVIDGGNRG